MTAAPSREPSEAERQAAIIASALNSAKRLNNDAAVKAQVWKDDFGRRQVAPAAVLAGVFNLRHLVEAQDRGLALLDTPPAGPD